MAKGDKFYFENFANSTALAKDAATYLVECLENYDPDKIESMLEKMHIIEHSADMKKHEMTEALIKAFVTPVDREDLDMLSQKLDDVVDLIEEILQKFYIYNISVIKPDSIVFAKNIVTCCELMVELMAEFENFKKSKKLQQMIIQMNDLEEECDRLYLESMHQLTKEPEEVLLILSWRDVYDCLEGCVDACEHVSDCVATVIMKNT